MLVLLDALQSQRLGAGEGLEDGLDVLVSGRRVELQLQLSLLRREDVDGVLLAADLLSLCAELVLRRRDGTGGDVGTEASALGGLGWVVFGFFESLKC